MRRIQTEADTGLGKAEEDVRASYIHSFDNSFHLQVGEPAFTRIVNQIGSRKPEARIFKDVGETFVGSPFLLPRDRLSLRYLYFKNSQAEALLFFSGIFSPTQAAELCGSKTVTHGVQLAAG